jgi:hypothetical protein
MLCVALFASLLCAVADEPLDKADRAALEDLLSAVMARVEASTAAGVRLKEADQTLGRAKAAFDKAEQAVGFAEMSVKTLEESFPKDLMTVESEIKLNNAELAKSEDQLATMKSKIKPGMPKPDAVMAAEMRLAKAKISLQNAKTKMDVLVRYSKKKKDQNLKEGTEKAKLESFLRKQELDQAAEAHSLVERHAQEEKLLPDEKAALLAVVEASDLFEVNNAKSAREKLAEARATWEKAQQQRADTRFENLRVRAKVVAGSMK